MPATVLVLFLAPLPQLIAQETSTGEPVVDAAVLKRKIDEVGATDSLDEATVSELTEFYRKALTNLEQSRSDLAAAENYIAAAKNAPAETARLNEVLEKRDKLTGADTLRITARTPVEEIAQSLTKEKADLAAVEAKLAGLRQRYDAEIARPAAAGERLKAARQEQETTGQQIEASAVPGEFAAVTEARRWFLQTRALALSAEIKKLDQELLSHQARFELLEAERDDAAWAFGYVAERVRALEEILATRRREQAEQAQEEATTVLDEMVTEHPIVRALAQENAATSDTLAEFAAALESVSAENKHVRDATTRIENALSSTRSKLAIAGLNQALGHVLIEQRQSLPDSIALREQAKLREKKIAQTALRMLELSEERKALRDSQAYADDRLADLAAAQAAELRPQVLELTQSRRDLVRRSADSAAAYLQALSDLDIDATQLATTSRNYDDFLGKHLLWMRSVPPIDIDVVRSIPADIGRLFSPSSWARVAQDFLAGLLRTKWAAFVLAVLLVLVMQTPRLRTALTASAASTWRARDDHIAYTVKAAALTALIAAPAPLGLIVAGWTIRLGGDPAAFSAAIAETWIVVATDYLLIALFLGVCLDNGLAAKHFRWPAEAVGKFRRELQWLIVVYPIARFLGFSSALLDAPAAPGGLRVFGGLAAAAALSVFIYRMLTPRGGVIRAYLEAHPGGLAARLRPVWVVAASAILPIFAGVWLAGYTYTGNIVATYFWRSLWLLGALVVAHAVALRWLMVVRRRLQFDAAVERLKTAREAAQDDESSEGALEVEEPAVDFATLDANGRKLLKTIVVFSGVIAYWFIWSETIPALTILEDMTLWSSTASVDGIATKLPVSAADLILAVIVGIATFAAAQGLPSILEFVLLESTSVTAGGRYAVITLLRYTIFGVGALFVIDMLGGSWSQVQWLVAALGVGIGFGLQEIVANFVSGLIILFERPIRIGDTVTVGETSGVVTRIRIRATTITDWDRKELIVPNKEFVTSRLLNWTLSDPVTRVVIPVGIAYGSDVARAMLLVKEAAEENTNVVADPRPFVTFEGFGDNSLDLLVRAYLPSLENRLRTASDLREAINEKFNEAGIVVAFPQRDIHFDTSNPIDIRLHGGGENPA